MLLSRVNLWVSNLQFEDVSSEVLGGSSVRTPEAEGFTFIPRYALFLFVEMLGHLPGICQVTHRKCLGCRDDISLRSSLPLLALGHTLGLGASVPSPGSRHGES